MSRTEDDLIRRTRGVVLATVALLTCALIGSVVVWRVRLSYEVNERLRALQQAGLPTSGTELNQWYASVPDSENAALVLTQAFALMRTFPDQRSNEVFNFKPPPRGQPLKPEETVLLADYVVLNAAALAKAREMIQFPKSRFPVDFSPGFNTTLSHLAKLKGLSQTASFEALLALPSNRTEDAANGVILMLKLAQTLDNEPVPLSQLVRVAILRLSTRTVERSLATIGWSNAELSLLASEFAGAEKTNLMALALIGERATVIPYSRDGWAFINQFGKSEDANDEGSQKPSYFDFGTFLSRATGFFERDLKFYLRFMETNISLANAPPPRSLTATNFTENSVAEAKRRHYLISNMLIVSLSIITVREAECLAELRTTQAVLAVERFRLKNERLPNDLNALTPQFLPAVPIDPFDGAPLRYKRLAKGYVVYSIGPDGQDDGGKEPPIRHRRVERVPEDITFTAER